MRQYFFSDPPVCGDGTFDEIFESSPCNDLPVERIRRIILTTKQNDQNGATPIFATIADFSVALNWTNFLIQAPVDASTVMLTPSMFEFTRQGGQQTKKPNGYNNYSVQGNKTNAVYTATFLGVSQDFINAMLSGTDDNFGNTAVWFVTDRNELIYIQDATLQPKLLDCVVVMTEDEGSTSGDELQKYVLSLEIQYGLGSNLRSIVIPTSAANLIGL